MNIRDYADWLDKVIECAEKEKVAEVTFSIPELQAMSSALCKDYNFIIGRLLYIQEMVGETSILNFRALIQEQIYSLIGELEHKDVDK